MFEIVEEDPQVLLDQHMPAKEYFVVFWTKVSSDTWSEKQVQVKSDEVAEVLVWAEAQKVEREATTFQIWVIVEPFNPEDPDVGWALLVSGPINYSAA